MRRFGLGMILIFAGALLLSFGLLPMTTLVVEPIPSVPADGQTYASLKTVEIILPKTIEKDGINYSIDDMGVRIRIEPNTVVWKWLSWEDLGTKWRFYSNINPLADGNYQYSFEVRLTSPSGQDTWWIKGNFKIDSSIANIKLTGDWYIGSTKIISPSQTVTVYTNNILFKFVKTSTVPEDSQITCTVSWGDGSQALTYQGTGIWSDTIYFASGTYNIDLVATDGTTTVRMSILMGIDEEPTEPTLPIPIPQVPASMRPFMLVSGAFMTVAGIVLVSTKRRR